MKPRITQSDVTLHFESDREASGMGDMTVYMNDRFVTFATHREDAFKIERSELKDFIDALSKYAEQ